MKVLRNPLYLNKIYKVTYQDLSAIAATSGDVVIKTLPANTLVRDVIWKPTEAFNDNKDQTVTDGVTNTDTSFVSATAAFTTAKHAGKAITGAGIPAGTTISSVTNTTTVVLSNATTATATGVTAVIAQAGHGVSAVTARVITAANNYGSAALDVFQAPSDTVLMSDVTLKRESAVAAVDLKVHFVSTAGNLNTLTHGVLLVVATLDTKGLALPVAG